MSRTTYHMSIFIDGLVAGPDQSRENPVMSAIGMPESRARGGRRAARQDRQHDSPLRYRRCCAAHEQARAAARDVDIAGGALVVQQALTANAIAEPALGVVLVVLGAGERLFIGVPDPGLEPVQVIHSRYATHGYRPNG